MLAAMNWGHTHGIIHRADAIARGYTDNELHSARRRGDLIPLGRGVYISAVTYAELDAVARHRVAVNAALSPSTGNAATQMSGGVASHVSAAVMHGLDLWNLDLSKVHVTKTRRSGGTSTRRRVLHAGRLPPEEIVTVDGVLVTSPARTIVDIACANGFEQAVVVGDHALRIGATTADGLRGALDLAAFRQGVARARRVAAFVDGLSESVGESRSRVLIDQLGLPRPLLQQPLYDASGHFIGRTDFFWPQLGVVGEFDGIAKYSMVPGKSQDEALRAEKQRENALTSAGYIVVRWLWEDLSRPRSLRFQLEQAFAAARANRRVQF